MEMRVFGRIGMQLSVKRRRRSSEGQDAFSGGLEACQNLRAALSSGPLSRREQQIVNLAVARHKGVHARP